MYVVSGRSIALNWKPYNAQGIDNQQTVWRFINNTLTFSSVRSAQNIDFQGNININFGRKMASLICVQFVFELFKQLLVINSVAFDFQCLTPSTIADLTMQNIFCDVKVTLNDQRTNHWRHPQSLIEHSRTTKPLSIGNCSRLLRKPPCIHLHRHSVGSTGCAASLRWPWKQFPAVRCRYRWFVIY